MIADILKTELGHEDSVVLSRKDLREAVGWHLICFYPFHVDLIALDGLTEPHLMDVDVLEFRLKLLSSLVDYSDRLSVVTVDRGLDVGIEVKLLEEIVPPDELGACARKSVEFGLSGGFGYRALLGCLPVNWQLEEFEDVSIRAGSRDRIVGKGSVRGTEKAWFSEGEI